MPVSLSKAHRKLLENTTADARVLAESACRAALENLAVHEKEYRGHMIVEQRKLRNRLRARGRAIGDARDTRTGLQDIHHLVELAAYEHWHRLLFTRFLTENHLLITDEANGSVPITLEECEELASDLGARDGQELACRFASRTLPGVFRRDDPVLDLPVALNDQVELRKLLASLPAECFRADDALGWTYQFWQAQRKDEINDSGKKIGADELAPVTQLFTEDYMVEFLLHNTLGAWWAGKIGPIKASSEEEARAQAGLPARDGASGISWAYLRFVQDETAKTWLPAAGIFQTWPKSASQIRLLDPCMGSGHFLVFALPLLARLRMEEEHLSAQNAVVAALRDNIHGLELDERCTQIAAFNVALTSWKLAGYQALVTPHLACSGQAPSGTDAEWMALAGQDDRLRRGMMRLHSLFKDAPILGSLINPRVNGGNLIEAEFHELAPLLASALAPREKQNARVEEDAAELGVIAQGLARAADLLAGQFTLVTTNVPYLGRGKQEESLRAYCENIHADAKGDLATCFGERCLDFCAPGGTSALVTPQHWFYLGAYKRLRQKLLADTQWNLVSRLGAGAFDAIGGEVVNVCLIGITRIKPKVNSCFLAVDVADADGPLDKAVQLSTQPVREIVQADQLATPDSRIILEILASAIYLKQFADSRYGLRTGDLERLAVNLWELPFIGDDWKPFLGTVDASRDYGGRERVLLWQKAQGVLHELADCGVASIQGADAWGKHGVAVSLMGALQSTLYTGEIFDNGTGAIWPRDPANLLAIYCFCSSKDFPAEVRKIDKSLKITNQTLLKVPFDSTYWQRIAAEKYPGGPPKPDSDDPTQWLFNGHPAGSAQPLHVSVARLLGFRWPRQTGSSFPGSPALGPDGLEKFAATDGIVCLPAVNREQPAAARVRQLLTAALGTIDERTLVAGAGVKGSKSKSLEAWLRDEFFEQHSKIFYDRPFIWHLWDGRADGFHALVNYHLLDHANLQKLTYSYLGDWIQQQAEDAKADKPGAAERLGAARALQDKLAAILEGEAPLDIFVRWKPLKEQAQGWHPDLNDGVRQNIRPFLLAGDVGKRGAGLFRAAPLSLKDKDRGTEPERSKTDYPWFWCEQEPGTDPKGGKEFIGNRWNDVHLTLETKQKARA